MKSVLARVPDFESLKAGLGVVLGGNGSGSRQVTIRDRKPVMSASTYPSEVVDCRLGCFRFKLYCKYSAGLQPDSYGHRGGVPYEAVIYRSLLQNSELSLPKFYGAYTDPATGDTWLVLEYLEDILRLAKGPQPESMLRAARWIGRFHAANENCASTVAFSFLNRYDIRYFEGWVRRTSLFAKGLDHDLSSLETICGRLNDFLPLLLSPGFTVIHGEYYPHNVLIKGDLIYPIDWESAAIAAGEIDLATLTEAWPPEIARPCEIEYQRARWPGGTPAKFKRRLAAARLYQSFRWLGEQPEWTRGTGNFFYFEQMRSAGKELGLI